MMDRESKVLHGALEILSQGPLTLSELTVRLRATRVLEAWTELDEGAQIGLVDEILLDSDAVWHGEGEMVAAVATLLDGVCFTHRVSESERERQALTLTPDLDALDVGADDSLRLNTGGAVVAKFSLDDETDVNGSYVGPPDWLDSHDSETLTLRRQGTIVTLSWGDEWGAGEREAAALRRAFDDSYVPGVAQEPLSIVMNALVADGSLFRLPVAPVGELLERVGLERIGAWVGLEGEGALAPMAIARAQRVASLGERFGFERCCREHFDFVLGSWFATLGESPDPELLRGLAHALAHAANAPAFAAYMLDDSVESSTLLGDFAQQLTTVSGPAAAVGYFLLAQNLELDDDTLGVESALGAALRADPTYEPALVEMAWFHCDRGDATRASQLLGRVNNIDVEDERARLRHFARPRFVGVGRNDACPCGSGRKFKVCCHGALAPIEDRTDWLVHKLAMFVMRPKWREYVRELLEVAYDAAGDGVDVFEERIFPLVADLAAYDDEALSLFLSVRGSLLPDDERELLNSWGEISPSLFQVTMVNVGASVEVFDTRTAESYLVSERLGSSSMKEGDYIYARVVAVGSSYQFIGEIINVEMFHRASLVHALDSDSPWVRAQWIGSLFAPPTMVNTEGEALMMCRAVLEASGSSWSAIFARLDEEFGVSPDQRWTDIVEIEAETRVRSFVNFEDNSLVVVSNSRERLARTVERLTNNVGDLVVTQRDEPYVPDGAPRVLDDNTPDPQLQSALAEFVAKKEAEWLGLSIPALGGLTPREAVVDPSRREDLVALLNEFDRRSTAGTEFVTFNTDRLRRELGLDA